MAAADWSRFGGPNGLGVPESAAPAVLDDGVLLWRAAPPPGHSPPVVRSDGIHPTAAEGGTLWTYCLDSRNGEPPPYATLESMDPTRRLEWALLAMLVVSAAAMAMTPWWLGHPARAQSRNEIELMYALRGGWSAVFSITSLLAGALLTLRRWMMGGGWEKLVALFCLMAVGLTAVVANMNLLAEVFPPIEDKRFAAAAEADFLRDDDRLLVYLGAEPPRAYPIRLLAFHHLVADEDGGVSYLATYCMLCRAGAVWKAEVDGQPLAFGLASIENQNFLMQDGATGSWWRQATGEALTGALRGRKLEALPSEIVTLDLLRRERPDALVLRPAANTTLVDDTAAAGRGDLPAPPVEGPLGALEQVAGVVAGEAARAYPLDAVRVQGVVADRLGGVPVVVLAAPDGTVRAFDARVEGRELTLAPGAAELRWTDAETGSEWSFAGEAAGGELAGRRLARLPVRVESWYSWKRAYPESGVFPAR